MTFQPSAEAVSSLLPISIHMPTASKTPIRQDLYQLLFERSADGIMLLEGDRFTYGNPSVLRMLGCDEEDFKNTHPWDVSPSFQPDGRDSREAAREMIHMAWEKGLHRFDWVHRRMDGTSFPVEVTLIPVSMENREFVYATWRDITHRKAMEQTIRDSEAHFRAVAFLTGQLIYDLNLATGQAQWDGAIEELTGQSVATFRSEGILGWESRLHPEDRAMVMEELQKAADSCRTFQAEYRFRHANGSWLTVRDKGLFLPDASGRIVRRLGALSDVTGLRRAEQERLALERQVLHAQKLESLGVLAGGIAHDFNNLLTAMMGNLNLAQMHLPEDSPALGFLENLERTVMRASELTRQMLAYSGKGRFVVSRQDLGRVVEELMSIIQVSIPRHTEVILDLEPDLPEIQADSAQLQQVVLNLITNARDAIGERGGTIRVSTGRVHFAPGGTPRELQGQALRPGPHVVLEVRDTGCGMTPEVLERIFDPFFTTKPTGHGLGLSAMLGIMRAHQGAVDVQSTPDRGTCFRLYFPACGGGGSQDEEAPAPAPWRGEGLVLVVDDEPGILEVSVKAFSAMGFQVISASDGQEAIECALTHRDDLRMVFMDVTMPRMDGREACRRLQERLPGLPILLTSGFSEQDVSQPAERVPFIQKPFRIKELRQKVQEVLVAVAQ